MRFWLVMIGEPLPVGAKKRRLRTAMLADALCARGHEVTWWSSAFEHDTKTMICDRDRAIEVNARFRLQLARGIGYSGNFSVRRYLDHRVVGSRLVRAARLESEKPDLILATVPDHNLAYRMCRIGVELGIPVIIDVRDQWPEVFLRPLPHAFRPLGRLALTLDFWRLRWCLSRARSLTSMMEQLLEWALLIANRERSQDDRVFFLGAEDLPDCGPEFLPQEVRDRIAIEPNARIITFAGKFGEFYNPEIMVRAAMRLRDSGSGAAEYLFVLAGNGPYLPDVRRAAAAVPNVILTGWLGPEATAALLRSSHLLIVPCTQPIVAFPNKAFAYLSAGAPIVSSVYGEFRDMIERTRIGANYEPGDDQMLAAKISAILSNEEERVRMGRVARQLFREKFNARTIYREFTEFLQTVAARHRKEPSLARLEKNADQHTRARVLPGVIA